MGGGVGLIPRKEAEDAKNGFYWRLLTVIYNTGRYKLKAEIICFYLFIQTALKQS
jgi:hypothetical protein